MYGRERSHGLEGCDVCGIYHCLACGCPRDGRKSPNFPYTESGNDAYIRHRLDPQERALLEQAASSAIGQVAS